MSTMIEILQRIIETRGAECYTGLCDPMYAAEDFGYVKVREAFESWEHYSGSDAFPVPNPEKPGDPAAAQEIYCQYGDPGYYVGEYGELRLDLARHLLRELSK